MSTQNMFFINFILLIVCVIICFIFSILSLTRINASDYVYISSIGKNWDNSPLWKLEASGYNCTSDKSSAINQFWSGTEYGCYCESMDGLHSGSCDEENEMYCSDVENLFPIEFKFWKGINMCMKKRHNYLDLKIVKEQNQCGSEYKPCGVIDSLNQILCYPDKDVCPYNEVKVLGPKEPVPQDKKYDVLPLGIKGSEGNIIFSNENIRGTVITQFKIDDDTPCLSPDYKNLKHTPYLLEKSSEKNECKNEIGGELIDKYYTKIDSIDYNRLYSENQIMGLLKSLPNYKIYDYSNSTTNLYYKNYIGLDYKCFSNIKKDTNTENIISDLLKVESLVSSSSLTCTFCLIFSTLGLFIIIWSIPAYFCVQFDLKILHILIIFFFFIPSFICSCVYLSRINGVNQELQFLQDCTDQITKVATYDFMSNISSISSIGIAHVIFSILCLTSNILGIFCF